MTMTKSPQTYDVETIRADFPVLHQEIHGKSLVYLDNAASSQKPRAVTGAIESLYDHDYSNIHRGVHELSQRSTRLYEDARSRVREFIGAASDREIVFTRGTTEAINLVAASWGRTNLSPGDEIVLTELEHHSNIVPWQLIANQTGARIVVCPILDSGEVEASALVETITDRTKLVAISHVSNALGTIVPVEAAIRRAREVGATVLLDGAQAAPHAPVDVRELDADFYAFSGHKVYGPTGIGVLYGREAILDAMPPYQGGGDMIRSVSFEKTEYNELPFKFEAGTPNIAGAIGLGAAIDYVSEIGLDRIAAHEADLHDYASEQLAEIDGLRLIGTAPQKAAVVSFVIDGIHPHDIGTIVDREGVAVRAGHHCAQPVMDRLRVPATTRASFAAYNTRDEVDRLVAAVTMCREVFG